MSESDGLVIHFTFTVGFMVRRQFVRGVQAILDARSVTGQCTVRRRILSYDVSVEMSGDADEVHAAQFGIEAFAERYNLYGGFPIQ